MAVPNYTYISTVTASSSANIDFTGIDSTYNAYRLVVNNLLVSTSLITANFKLSTDSLSTFATTCSAWIGYVSTVSASGMVVDASNTLSSQSIPTSKASSVGICGWIDVFMPADSTVQTMVSGLLTNNTNSSPPNSYEFKAQDETRQAINAFRLAASTGGTFTSGTVTLYGVS